VVPPTTFTLSLEIRSEPVPAGMLEELAAAILRHAGCPVTAASELGRALKTAAAEGALSEGRCHVHFRAHDRAIEILVSAAGGSLWQTSCAIP
jgi:hypothetical protein